jgi:hypothetical protein
MFQGHIGRGSGSWYLPDACWNAPEYTPSVAFIGVINCVLLAHESVSFIIICPEFLLFVPPRYFFCGVLVCGVALHSLTHSPTHPISRCPPAREYFHNSSTLALLHSCTLALLQPVHYCLKLQH